jgi:hypothetical protein
MKSTLTKFRDEIGTYAPIDAFINHPLIKVKGYVLSAAPLKCLYFVSELGFDPGFVNIRDSLYGRYYPLPVLNIKDSTIFRAGRPLDNAVGYYNYSMEVSVKNASKKFMMKVMQDDLKNNFGYEIKLERRTVEIWNLIAMPGAEIDLKAKDNIKYSTDTLAGMGALGFETRNAPIIEILSRIQFYTHEIIPFVDKTGIKTNIDIVIKANMRSIKEIRAELQRNKLDLIKKETEMECLIISDPINAY